MCRMTHDEGGGTPGVDLLNLKNGQCRLVNFKK